MKKLIMKHGMMFLTGFLDIFAFECDSSECIQLG